MAEAIQRKLQSELEKYQQMQKGWFGDPAEWSCSLKPSDSNVKPETRLSARSVCLQFNYNLHDMDKSIRTPNIKVFLSAVLLKSF